MKIATHVPALVAIGIAFFAVVRGQTPSPPPLPITLIFDKGTITNSSGVLTVGGFSTVTFKNTGALYNVAADGKIALTFPLSPQPGPGLIGISYMGTDRVKISPIWAADTAYIVYRVDAPAGPGPCVNPFSQLPRGTAVEAIQDRFLFKCTGNPDTSRWVRYTGELDWVQ